MLSIMKGILLLIVALVLIPSAISAAPLDPEKIPEPLQPWTDWVVDQNNRCPYMNGMESGRICVWSSKLTLSLSDKEGSFNQLWRVYADSWVPLPGDNDRWPLEVMVDSTPAAVILLQNQPRIFLKKGEHAVAGSFQWDSIPESFQIPEDAGILQLTIRGTEVTFPVIDENGLVWLQGKEKEREAQDSLTIRVHRHMVDGVPFTLTTQISLDVSGKTREVLLGPVILDEFIPMSLNSTLPADIQPDGFIRVQIRAGQWELRVSARHTGPVSSLTLPAGENATRVVFQPDEEVWVLEARNDLRLVSIEGVPAVDPQQTTLPDEWKQLPAFRLVPGNTVRLVEQRRGDSSPAPDQLHLQRNYWLDFDGNGYTVNDYITGTFNNSRRLDMNSPMKLGRVAVNGDTQLITNLPGQKQEGIEIRLGQAQIVADSRLENAAFRAPAVGWDHNFQSVSGILHLPPGWKLLAATGADRIPSTWINRWTLLQIFLVLILTVSFARMWGKRWGLIALLTFLLSFPERDAPQWIWPAVLIASVLLRLIHRGRLLLFLKTYRIVTLVILIMICLPFMVDQMRMALYPSYEYSRQINENQSLGYSDLEKQIQSRNQLLSSAYNMPNREPSGGLMNKEALSVVETTPPASEAPMEQKALNQVPRKQQANRATTLNTQSYIKINPSALVQTGPGLPRWEGTAVSLQWTGPVEKNQFLHFFLLPPWMNLALTLLRILLIAMLVLCVIGLPGDFRPSSFIGKTSVPAGLSGLILVFGLCFYFIPSKCAADFPSPELLKDLQQRLSKVPDCHPHCSAISRMQLGVAGNTLRIRLQAGAQDETAIPLPGNVSDWTPQQVFVDARKFPELHRSEDGNLWLKLSPGAHQIVLEGPLPKRASVQIPLPMKPHYAVASLDGWTLDGLHEDGIVDENLKLTRVASNQTEDRTGEEEDSSGSLPPFVIIQRQLILGLNWQMETHVSRLTSPGSAVILDIPLLEGESVTTAGLRIQNGKVQVNMAPQVSSLHWTSVLKESAKIHLKAADSFDWVEVWRLDASPLWHLTLEGIPVIHQQSTSGTWLPEWHPWPGEKVDITVIRPEGVSGQTVTIDQSVLSITPGQRYSQTILNLSLRSSLGGQHNLILPKEADLQSVSINGVVQPVMKAEQKVTLPLTPGEQRVELKWQQPGGIKPHFRSPLVELKLPSVNSETQLHLPADRWIFFVGGHGVGPAVLFWGFFVILILAAIGLGRVPLTPLKAHHWLLLGLGLSQVPVWYSVAIAGWFLVSGYRKDRPVQNKWLFDLLQLGLVLWTTVALVLVFISIEQGLLGLPDMQVRGNNSSAELLRWFQDRSPDTLPRAWVVSLPLYFYRIVMLFWALWLALALIRWLKWAWTCFSSNGVWKSLRPIKQATVTDAPEKTTATE